MNTSGLSIRRLVSYQQYTAPLIVVSETAQQTALPLLEAMVRESLVRNMRVVAVCIDGLLSRDIADSPETTLVDQRPSLGDILGADRPCSAAADAEAGTIDQDGFARLQSAIDSGIRETQAQQAKSASGGSDAGVLVVIDSLDRLLRSSQTATLVLVRRIRRTINSLPKSRLVTRFSRDLLWDNKGASASDKCRGLKSGSYAANALCELADATVDVHPLDDLKTWMPGWYSDGKAQSFMSLRDNDFRRGLVRLEHKRQSGKIGFEVSTFEIDPQSRLLRFSAVEVSAEPRLPQVQPQSPTQQKQQTPSQTLAKGASEEQRAQAQPATDPAANLSFNLSLTDKQRQDKASVELPYLDAQVVSAGEIHYQMDDEDDWDEDDPDDDLEI
ncbi:hypothetical protein LPJ75_001662 [Coemansia sp. RSA 2598]|nr:hypothetical protein LPJ75_001662 [Coemansia sp. RSA 2598]